MKNENERFLLAGKKKIIRNIKVSISRCKVASKIEDIGLYVILVVNEALLHGEELEKCSILLEELINRLIERQISLSKEYRELEKKHGKEIFLCREVQSRVFAVTKAKKRLEEKRFQIEKGQWVPSLSRRFEQLSF